MPTILPITDFLDPQLDIYARLSENQLLNRCDPQNGIFIAESPKVIERALDATVRPDRINYLLLMMVDPHVHFHVLPRYNGARSRGTLTIPDGGWPKVPDLAAAVTLDADTIADHVRWLRGALG